VNGDGTRVIWVQREKLRVKIDRSAVPVSAQLRGLNSNELATRERGREGELKANALVAESSGSRDVHKDWPLKHHSVGNLIREKAKREKGVGRAGNARSLEGLRSFHGGRKPKGSGGGRKKKGWKHPVQRGGKGTRGIASTEGLVGGVRVTIRKEATLLEQRK